MKRVRVPVHVLLSIYQVLSQVSRFQLTPISQVQPRLLNIMILIFIFDTFSDKNNYVCLILATIIWKFLPLVMTILMFSFFTIHKIKQTLKLA